MTNAEMWLILVALLILVIVVGWIFYSEGYDDSEKEGNKYIDELHKRILSLEKLCELADVPPMLIQNPDMLNGEITDKDREWAKKAIEEYKNKEG